MALDMNQLKDFNTSLFPTNNEKMMQNSHNIDTFIGVKTT